MRNSNRKSLLNSSIDDTTLMDIACVPCFFFLPLTHYNLNTYLDSIAKTLSSREIMKSFGRTCHLFIILLKNFHLFKIAKLIINFYLKKKNLSQEF